MEQSRKHLRISSIIVLIFAGLTLLNLVSELAYGELNNAAIPADAPDNILLITKIFVLVVSFIFLLPQTYVGIKGLKLAKKPDASKAHIVIAVILLVLAATGLSSPALALIKGEDIFENISAILSIIVEILVFFDYIKFAIAVRKEVTTK